VGHDLSEHALQAPAVERVRREQDLVRRRKRSFEFRVPIFEFI